MTTLIVRLIGYVRVSKVGGREGDSFQSPREQRRAIEAIVALTKGAVIVEWVEDLDESGGTMDRPGAKRAIAMVEAGQADGLACAYLDRFARTMEALELIERWGQEGKVFISAAERFDTSTWVGKFSTGMMLLVAKMFRDRAIEQWDASCKDAVAVRGVHVTVPYGYRRGEAERGRQHARGGVRGTPLVIHEPEAEIVRRIFRERVLGVGLTDVAEALNSDGIASPRGGRWTRQAINALVRVRAYAGDAHRGAYLFTDAHEAIVGRDDWEAAQRPPGPPRINNRSLLVGLARCSGCGYVLGAGSNRQHRRYGCVRKHSELLCPHPTTAMADALEELVTDLFLAKYGRTRMTSASTADPAVASTASALARARAEFALWRDDAAMREILGDEEYREGLVARKRHVDATQAAHEHAVRHGGAQSLSIDEGLWDDLTLAERRELLRHGIDAVVLRRARSSHEPLVNRVQVRWAGELDHDGSRRGIAIAVRDP